MWRRFQPQLGNLVRSGCGNHYPHGSIFCWHIRCPSSLFSWNIFKSVTYHIPPSGWFSLGFSLLKHVEPPSMYTGLHNLSPIQCEWTLSYFGKGAETEFEVASRAHDGADHQSPRFWHRISLWGNGCLCFNIFKERHLLIACYSYIMYYPSKINNYVYTNLQ